MTKFLLGLGTIALFAASLFPFESFSGEMTSFRMIPIPEREHGYSNFDSTFLVSQDALDEFLKSGSKAGGMGWNSRKDFEEAITKSRVDFGREVLVLLRHTEGSGSVQIRFRTPIVKQKRLICHIDRKEPQVGTADMAYYCFALAVDKAAVAEVELEVPGRKQLLLSLKQETRSNRAGARDGS